MSKEMLKYLATILVIFSSPSWACSCVKLNAEDYISHCDVLFLAKLKKAELSKDGSEVTGKFGKATKVFKGASKSVRGLVAPINGISCDLNPMVGAEYLVCAKAQEKHVELDSCSYTRRSTRYYPSGDLVQEIKNAITHNQ